MKHRYLSGNDTSIEQSGHSLDKHARAHTHQFDNCRINKALKLYTVLWEYVKRAHTYTYGPEYLLPSRGTGLTVDRSK